MTEPTSQDRAEVVRLFDVASTKAQLLTRAAGSICSSPQEVAIVFAVAAESLRYAAALPMTPEERVAFLEGIDSLVSFCRESAEQLQAKNDADVSGAVEQVMRAVRR